MDANVHVSVMAKRGAEDAGRYFKYMADFVGLKDADVQAIRQSAPVIEKHLPEIVSKFYAHLLRYPPTRKFFLKKDGVVDQDYVELRMRHLTNFWIRTAQGVYDDDYARYVDYVGRAHTSHGADPHIYIAERYVIGQVGFVQHAIAAALTKELREGDAGLEHRAVDAWDKLLMVILEMLARAYGTEREAETFDALVSVDTSAVSALAQHAYEHEHAPAAPVATRQVLVARAPDIPDGDRTLIQIDGLSIGVFHHKGNWYAVRNWCLHRGGPVATGCLEGDTLTCPWHGFEYNLMSGQLLVDPSARLEQYPVMLRDGEVYIQVPVTTAPVQSKTDLPANEFLVSDIPPGKSKAVQVDGESVAVFNVEGTLFVTQDECTHAGGPLSEGDLVECTITCPLHGSQFDVGTGNVVRGPAKKPLTRYRVALDGERARVERL
ncbi:MAG: Rieske 2Fe-2S domain-containing protein [Chloroflexi bacterium]|nr:Rieske 2Fe-2S domain-containing protein [Chloroflexota bacterium]